MKYKTIFFDLDGTITDSAPGIMNSIKYALEKNHLPMLSEEQLRSFIGPPLRGQFCKVCGLADEESARMVEDYREYYRDKGIFGNNVYDGVIEMLEKLRKKGFRLAIATLDMGVRERHLTNRGFLLGPCCPIYGAGMLGITLLFQGSHYGYWHVFFSIILLCSLLEYAVSALMERVFHTRWWDYHDMKFNIHGRICLETMLPFGLLGTFALYRINPFLMMLFHRIPGYVSGKLVTGVVVLFLADRFHHIPDRLLL